MEGREIGSLVLAKTVIVDAVQLLGTGESVLQEASHKPLLRHPDFQQAFSNVHSGVRGDRKRRCASGKNKRVPTHVKSWSSRSMLDYTAIDSYHETNALGNEILNRKPDGFASDWSIWDVGLSYLHEIRGSRVCEIQRMAFDMRETIFQRA